MRVLVLVQKSPSNTESKPTAQIASLPTVICDIHWIHLSLPEEAQPQFPNHNRYILQVVQDLEKVRYPFLALKPKTKGKKEGALRYRKKNWTLCRLTQCLTILSLSNVSMYVLYLVLNHTIWRQKFTDSPEIWYNNSLNITLYLVLNIFQVRHRKTQINVRLIKIIMIICCISKAKKAKVKTTSPKQIRVTIV